MAVGRFHVCLDHLYTSPHIGSFPVIILDTLNIFAASIRKK